MPTPSTILEWIATAPGVAMNPDGHYGLQCVDLVDQYAQDIFGVPWNVSVGGVVGAKQLLDVAPDAYWIRTNNNPNNPNLLPSQGDVVVFGGSPANQWGHTAVVDSAHANGMWVIQQDGFAPPLIWANGNWYSGKPAHRTWLPYYGAGTGVITGWLTPRTSKLAAQDSTTISPASSVSHAANQRKTAGASVNIRTAPSSTAKVIGTIPPNTIQTFTGWVAGEMIDNFNVWYKGTDGYVWCGGFTEKKIDGLSDLNPKLSGNQRQTGPAAVNIRKEPTSSSAIIGTIPPNTIQTFVGYAVGEMIDNFNVWYKGTDGYVWCGGFTAQSMEGLPNVTPIYTPEPTPAPVSPKYSFQKDFDFVEYTPAHISNVQTAQNNLGATVFPEKPEKVVIHQFDAKAKNPSIEGVINHFAAERPGKESSAHFSVSGSRIVQHVSLKDRAFHAGAIGNSYIGIETDPHQSAETIASTKKLLKALKEKYGYEFALTLHKDVPGNSTNCGIEINLSDYKLEVPAPVPVPTPVPEPQPVPVPPVSEEAVIDAFLASLKKLYFDSK